MKDETDLFSDLDALRYKPPPRDRPCFESHGDGMTCPRCIHLVVTPIEQGLLGGPDHVVELNYIEQMLVQDVARQRCSGGRADKKMSNRDDVEISREGIAGELAFCRLFDVFPDQVFYLGPVGDDPGDAIIGGFRIDVKTSRRQDSELLAAGHKTVGRIPVHALMTGAFPRYVLRGFAWSEDVLQQNRLVNLGYGPSYLYPRRMLRTWEGLMSDEQRVAEWRERISSSGSP